MAIVISGSGIDMGGNPVSNASQVDSSLINASQVDSTVINENGSNVVSQGELAYDVDTSSYIPNTLTSGAIIERGSNANGEYVKYASGLMECFIKGLGIGVNTINIWTYPAAFVEVIGIFPVGYHTALYSSDIAMDEEAAILTPNLSNTAIRNKSTSLGNNLFVRAIGRWK